MAASKEMTGSGPICCIHKAPLGLYCVEMEELACQECKEESAHKKYRFWTLQEAAQEHKVVLTISRETLLAKVKGREKAQKILYDMANHLKDQAQRTEKEIKDEFEKLHRFLQEEEEAKIAALREEEEQKSQKLTERMERITKDMSSISDTIRTIEQELEVDDISFLQNYRMTIDKTWRSLQDQQSQPSVSNFMTQLAELRKLPGLVHIDTAKRMCKLHREPELATGALIDLSKHLGNLKYRVWEKMLGTVQYTPVTLDPNTAAPCLSLSEELTSMRFCTDNPQLPDNPERFNFRAEMLGSQSFTSGRHCWDVEVGDNSNWAVGVATQSAKRKKEIMRSRRRLGILALCFTNSVYHVTTTRLPVNSKLQRVRVELDQDRGNVTFSDPAQNRPIFTIDIHFTEPVFPYFYSSCEEHPLKITPQEVRVSIEAPKQEEHSLFSGMWYW